MKNLKTKRVFFVILAFIFSFALNLYAAPSNVPSTQTAGGLEKLREDEARSKWLKKKMEEKKAKPKIEEKETAATNVPEGEKVLIKKINVEGATLLSAYELAKITAQYENKELSLSQIQKVADLITDAYRTKGYPTSRAYIPPQTIGKDGSVLIKVVEGKVGDISVKGNKYFKSSMYKKKIQLKQNELLNYSSLQKGLILINEKPDRSAKAVLTPGKSPGSTDIIIEAKDRLPIHVGYSHDDYGSRYVGRNRDQVTLEHNNFLGFDDRLYLQYQRSERSEGSSGTLESGQYILPLTNTLNLGVSASYARTKLGREFEPLDSVGKATDIGVFLSQSLILNDTLRLRLASGFNYKKIRNYLLGTEASRDDSRVARFNFDVDKEDRLGRTLFTAEADAGIPDIMGGLESKDPRASRVGAGGKFFKGVFNLYRDQPLPFSSNLLIKNTAQYTNNTLTAAEEFQIGGPYSVRGYAPGEYAGDRGLYSSAEWTCPFYFIPKSVNVPFTKVKLFDASRFVCFYDWGTVRISNPQPTDIKARTIRGCGLGARFNITNILSAKAEFAYPLGGPKSSDTSHQHMQPWIELTARI